MKIYWNICEVYIVTLYLTAWYGFSANSLRISNINKQNRESFSSTKMSFIRNPVDTSRQHKGINVESANDKSLQFINTMKDSDDPLVVILVGLPGSGKSYFARQFLELVGNSSNISEKRSWISLNQDALKSRKAVVKQAEYHLLDGKSIIIDRCNFDRIQRSHWIEIAKSCLYLDGKHDNTATIGLGARKVVKTFCIVMPRATDVDFCSKRAILRGEDDLHPEKTDWRYVCKNMMKSFSLPSVEENIDGVYFCRSESSLMTVASLLYEISK